MEGHMGELIKGEDEGTEALVDHDHALLVKDELDAIEGERRDTQQLLHRGL